MFENETTIDPPLQLKSKQPGIAKSMLYNGARFVGQQRSKGNSYDVEVTLLVRINSPI